MQDDVLQEGAKHMKLWFGAAGICFDENQRVLMVRNRDVNGWSVPSGGIENDETAEACCIREVREETGYTANKVMRLSTKQKVSDGYQIQTVYFLLTLDESIARGRIDRDIMEVDWISLDTLQEVDHLYPEDVQLILDTHGLYVQQINLTDSHKRNQPLET